MSEAHNVRVICRFRPFNKREIDCGEAAAADEQLKIVDGVAVQLVGEEHGTFQYDRVFGQGCTQEEVYHDVASETVANVMEGYNGTIFAYGQTGAGKSFSMFGKEHSADGSNLKGIIPRSAADLISRIEMCAQNDPNYDVCEIKCSFLEIYKEKIKDLLNPNGPVLKVRESKHKGVWVDGLVQEYVTSEAEVMQLIGVGEGNRHTAATAMNEASSRSHSVFIIETVQKFKDGSTKSGKLCLADLAGSERVKRSKVEGLNLEEAAMINKSLSALGNCIHALTEEGRGHIPFRDSKLTYVLRESLGGNSRTTLLVACSPHISSHEETLSTLRFAERAKTIQCSVKQNKLRSIEELTALVEKLEALNRGHKAYIKSLEGLLEQNGIDYAGVKAATGGASANLMGVSGMDSKEVREMAERLELVEQQKEDFMNEIEELKANSATVTDAIQETMAELEAAANNERDEKEAVMVEAAAEHDKLQALLDSEKEKLDEANAEKDALLELLEEKEEEVMSVREELETEVSELKTSGSNTVQEMSGIQKDLDESNNQVSSLKHENAQLNTSLSQVQLELAGAQDENGKFKLGAASSEAELTKIMRDKDQLDSRIKELEMMEQQLKNDNEKMAEKHTSLKESFSQMESGSQELLEAKIATEAKVTRELEEKTSVLEDLKREKAKSQQEQDEHREQLDKINAAHASLTAQCEELQASLSKMETEVSEGSTSNLKLESNITSKENEIKKLVSEMEAKVAAMDALQLTLTNTESRAKATGDERDQLAAEMQTMREEKTATALALRKARGAMGHSPRSGSGDQSPGDDMADAEGFEAELSNIMSKNDAIQTELAQAKHTISEAQTTNHELTSQVEAGNQEKSRLGDANKVLQEEVFELREELEQTKIGAAQKAQEADGEHRKQAATQKKEQTQELEAKNEDIAKANREAAKLKQELEAKETEISTEKEKRLQLSEEQSLSQGEITKQKHEIGQLEAKIKRKKENKAQLKKDYAELQEKHLEARRTGEQLSSEITQSKTALTRAKEDAKRLQDENSALNIKVQTEMASLAFWLQDHKDLTAEMEEERVIHKARVHKLEDRLASMEEQLSKVNEEKRESQKHVRDDLRQIKMLEKEAKKRKASEEKLQESNQELRTKMEVQGKLLNVQSQRMGELEKTARAAEEMVTAWKKHSEVIEMERDEALAQVAAMSASNGTKPGSLLGRYVRGIAKK